MWRPTKFTWGYIRTGYRIVNVPNQSYFWNLNLPVFTVGNFAQQQLWGGSAVTKSDSESIFQQQFSEYHGDDGYHAAIQYILTAAQSLGSQDYYKKSPVMILGLAGV